MTAIFRYSFLLLILFYIQAKAQPISQPDAAELKLGLKKLANTASVLYLAAHPDDENTGLIAYVDNELHARTGYLSLTRGDGGQNLIGTEQGELLGLVRTQELLQARKVDKGEQFFTRAYDFGYSKSAEESLEKWGKEKVLHDVVWVIRKFRPDVIITRFPDYDYYGHGHHTASAILAKEAYSAAADPKRFPEQLEYFEVWQPKRLLYNSSTWWKPNLVEYYKETGKKHIKVDIGKYNMLLGHTYNELAAESRSKHKSQGFGTSPKRGEHIEYLEHRLGDAPENEILDGVETSWERIKGGNKIAKLLSKAIKDFEEDQPSATIPVLISALKEMRKLPKNPLVDYKIEETKQLIFNFAGLWLEAFGEEFYVSPGDSLKLQIGIVNRSGFPLQIKGISIPETNKDTTLNIQPDESKLTSFPLTVSLPEDLNYSQPYWLEQPRQNDLYHIESYESLGKAREKAPLTAKFIIEVKGEEIVAEIPVLYHWTDPVAGAQYRQVEVTPKVTVNFTEPSYIFSSEKPQKIELIVKALENFQKGEVSLNTPKGWSHSPQNIPVEIIESGEEKRVVFEVTAPENSSVGEISAIFNKDSQKLKNGITTIDYPHIDIQTLFPKASVHAVKMEIEKFDEKIGYIPGAGDKVADMLRNIGYDLDIITADELKTADLSSYDVVITGIRAYNTIEELSYLNKKLVNYVEKGGRLIVQYNVNRRLVTEEIGPFPFSLSRNRVTVEESPVRFLREKHPILNNPNKIKPEDFEGWVQERGLYFADQWSEKYTPILSFQDPGEEFYDGSLLVTEYGKGEFIYTGISFFRQLPAGVPGAYKLFVNLISYESGK